MKGIRIIDICPILIICFCMVIVGCSARSSNLPNENTNSSISTVNSSTSILASENTTTEQYSVDIPAIAGDVPSVDIELAVKPLIFPEKMEVYQTVKPEITAEYVADLGAKLGLKGDVVLRPDESYLIHDINSSTFLRINLATGGIQYLVDKISTPSATLPSEDQAAQIASAYLVQHNLLLKDVKLGNVQASEKMNGVTTALAVKFNRTVDGFDLTGPGNKYSVFVGENGIITYMIINPVKYTPKEMVTIKSVDKAFDELKSNQKFNVALNTKTVTVDNITIAYWLESMTQGQDSIVPVYVFKGQCFDDAGKRLVDGFTGYVNAVK
jgi:hypothetical protein